MGINRDQLTTKLREYLGKGRWRHSLNVAAAARSLALIHAPRLADQAELAGILHDNAKRMGGAELTAAAARLDIELSAGEREQPVLLHGKVGAALAPERFGVDDAEVLQAMQDHVTGQPGMGVLSQLLFVADQSAADREFDGVVELRAVAERDLAEAVLLVAGHKLNYIVLKRQVIHPATVELYNEYVQRVAQRTEQAD